MAMDNTLIGLAVILGPICLAIVVLIVIEMTDRLPSPKDAPSSGAPHLGWAWRARAGAGPTIAAARDDRATRAVNAAQRRSAVSSTLLRRVK
jgi:hypothetical protein